MIGYGYKTNIKLVKKKDNKMHYTEVNLSDYTLSGKFEGISSYKLYRAKNDINGNPRHVLHFLDYLSLIGEYPENRNNDILALCEYAISHSKKHGGKKYRNKDFGGGIVFCTYSVFDLVKRIKDGK